MKEQETTEAQTIELVELVNNLNSIIPIKDKEILKRLVKVERKILSMDYDLSIGTKWETN